MIVFSKLNDYSERVNAIGNEICTIKNRFLDDKWIKDNSFFIPENENDKEAGFTVKLYPESNLLVNSTKLRKCLKEANSNYRKFLSSIFTSLFSVEDVFGKRLSKGSML